MTTQHTEAYRQVLAQATGLAADDKLRLLETLAAQVRGAIAPRKPHRIVEFWGIGRDDWDGTDAQDYINRERDAWDG